MERRMAGYGNRVMGSQYPLPQTSSSFSYSHVKSGEYLTKLNDKITDLSAELVNKQKRKKEAAVVGSLVSLMDSIASSKFQPKKPATPVPQQPNPELGYVFQLVQRQQEMMMNLMQSINKPKEAKSKNKKTYEPEDQIVQNYQRIKNNPDEMKRILAELNFDDDGAEDYADKERKLKFSANLSEDEKNKILKQMEKNKIAKPIPEDEKLKGIRRFRMIGYIVLLPIVLVSNMLEKRSKYYMESMKDMKNKIEVFKEVAQSWVLKAMKTVLVSTINDHELDLMLSNKESEVRSQSINSKVVKLQVRLNGIIEGLELLTNEREMPPPFRSFIEKLVNNKTYLPNSFLTPFEKSRLDFNEFGGLSNQTDERKRMIICFFFITKILVSEICLKPVDAGIPVTTGGKTVTNLKMIASILQISVVMIFLKVNRRVAEQSSEEQQILKRKRGQVVNPINDDTVMDKLFLVTEYEASFLYIGPYLEIIKKRILSWSDRMLKFCENSRIKAKN